MLKRGNSSALSSEKGTDASMEGLKDSEGGKYCGVVASKAVGLPGTESVLL